MKHKNIGDSFDSFLEDEGILEQAEEVATKRVVAFQIQAEMKNRNLSKTELAQEIYKSILDKSSARSRRRGHHI